MKKGLSRYVLTDEIYLILKEQIISQTYMPGEKINIDQVARELEVSNIPIREALSRLAAENMVYVVPFKGTYVASVSLQELDDIFEIRIELETMALRKAIALIPEDELKTLEMAMNKWKNSIWPKETEQRLELIAKMNQGLHGLMMEYCGNKSLKQTVTMYIERIQRYLSYVHKDIASSVMEEEWNEHMEILQYLHRGCAQEAEEALKKHLRQSHQRTRSLLLQA